MTAGLVHDLFLDCLLDPEDMAAKTAAELEETAKIVEGVTMRVGFDPQKLEANRERIVNLLYELPQEFFEKGGGGMTFLTAYIDRHGRQWGEHKNVEELMLLGLAIDKVVYLMPRDLWPSLPGGMPYFMVKE